MWSFRHPLQIHPRFSAFRLLRYIPIYLVPLEPETHIFSRGFDNPLGELSIWYLPELCLSPQKPKSFFCSRSYFDLQPSGEKSIFYDVDNIIIISSLFHGRFIPLISHYSERVGIYRDNAIGAGRPHMEPQSRWRQRPRHHHLANERTWKRGVRKGYEPTYVLDWGGVKSIRLKGDWDNTHQRRRRLKSRKYWIPDGQDKSGWQIESNEVLVPVQNYLYMRGIDSTFVRIWGALHTPLVNGLCSVEYKEVL